MPPQVHIVDFFPANFHGGQRREDEHKATATLKTTSTRHLVPPLQVVEPSHTFETTQPLPSSSRSEGPAAPKTSCGAEGLVGPPPPQICDLPGLSGDFSLIFQGLMERFYQQMSAATTAAAPAAMTTSFLPMPTFQPEDFLLTFGGEPEEDPELFIESLEAYFLEVGPMSHRHQVLAAHRQLRGVAARRNKHYARQDACIADLWRRLRSEFGTENNFSELVAVFTSSLYNRQEDIDVYVTRQLQLYRRLFPDGPEQRLIQQLIRQMPVSIRAALAVRKYDSVEEFCRTTRRVLDISADDGTEPAENWHPPRGASPPRRPPPPGGPVPQFPPDIYAAPMLLPEHMRVANQQPEPEAEVDRPATPSRELHLQAGPTLQPESEAEADQQAVSPAEPRLQVQCGVPAEPTPTTEADQQAVPPAEPLLQVQCGVPAEPTPTTEADQQVVPPAEPLHQVRPSNYVTTATISLQDVVKSAQITDPEVADMICRLRRITREGPEARGDVGFAKNYVVDGGILWRRGDQRRLYVPDIARPAVFRAFHDSVDAGHPAPEKTVRVIARHYAWPSMDDDVRRLVNTCRTCAGTTDGPHKQKGPPRTYLPRRPAPRVRERPQLATPSQNRHQDVVQTQRASWSGDGPGVNVTELGWNKKTFHSDDAL